MVSSSSSSTLNHPSSSHPLDDSIKENDDESFHPNPSSPFYLGQLLLGFSFVQSQIYHASCCYRGVRILNSFDERAVMIDELSIVETDKVIHTVETNMVKLVVEIECFGKSFDEFDKETGSSDGLQPKQADLSLRSCIKRTLFA
ncbi:hypothetical protein Tco_0976101 [Tanacetum coccineum]|uniref:Uncharacterized protein n=1 Tax=Tanacetum coccineum TaxID=301880 RepID=A0ABQ5EGA1_9ASTR